MPARQALLLQMHVPEVSLLITLIVFIITDLDRPKRWLIQVNQDAKVQLQDM